MADDSPVKTFTQTKGSGSETFRERFLECFSGHEDNANKLKDVVRELIAEGVPRRTLVGWAVEKGYSKGYVASLLSRIFVSLGLRERQSGAGRRPSAAALELLAHVRSRYGENFMKVLRAAWRAGRAQRAVVKGPTASGNWSSVRIVVPQLDAAANLGNESVMMNSVL